jgi:hypothetical protein
MSSDTHNSNAGKDQRGSSEDNIALQQQEERDPNKSDARDREDRKGGDNEKSL